MKAAGNSGLVSYKDRLSHYTLFFGIDYIGTHAKRPVSFAVSKKSKHFNVQTTTGLEKNQPRSNSKCKNYICGLFNAKSPYNLRNYLSKRSWFDLYTKLKASKSGFFTKYGY